MKKFLYIMVGFAILMLVFYTYIGGFTAPEVTIQPSKKMYVAGIPFRGSLQDEKFSNAFKRAAEVVDKNELQGVLGNIYYNDPERGDSIDAFIGVVVLDSTVAIPADYELRTVPARNKVIHAEASANVALLPKKLYKSVFDYAKENNLQLETFYVEWFPEENKGVVEVPVKE
jgi:effector-binding domain-containing protein